MEEVQRQIAPRCIVFCGFRSCQVIRILPELLLARASWQMRFESTRRPRFSARRCGPSWDGYSTRAPTGPPLPHECARLAQRFARLTAVWAMRTGGILPGMRPGEARSQAPRCSCTQGRCTREGASQRGDPDPGGPDPARRADTLPSSSASAAGGRRARARVGARASMMSARASAHAAQGEEGRPLPRYLGDRRCRRKTGRKTMGSSSLEGNTGAEALACGSRRAGRAAPEVTQPRLRGGCGSACAC